MNERIRIGLDFGGVVANHLTVKCEIAQSLFGMTITHGPESTRHALLPALGPEKYHQLHRDLFSGKSSQYNLASGEQIVIGRESYVHPTAQLVGPILIGNNCSIGKNVKLSGHVAIGDGCTILEDTVIEKSIIWRNARLGTRVNLKNSILADNCRLNAGSISEGAVLGNNVTVASNCKLKPGSKIWPGTRVGPET